MPSRISSTGRAALLGIANNHTPPLIDDNGVILWIDDLGVTSFIDDNGITTT